MVLDKAEEKKKSVSIKNTLALPSFGAQTQRGKKESK